ncbi:hypothetical protein HNR34_003371 [Geobacillus subterraneus]
MIKMMRFYSNRSLLVQGEAGFLSLSHHDFVASLSRLNISLNESEFTKHSNHSSIIVRRRNLTFLGESRSNIFSGMLSVAMMLAKRRMYNDSGNGKTNLFELH